jgi:hypothetical protein
MGRYGMAGNYYRRSGYVTLQDVPDPNREYVETFDNLTGGMNTFDLDFRLKGNESPFIQNLTWNKGSLSCRRGQIYLGAMYPPGQYEAETKRVYGHLWHGWLIAHVGGSLMGYKIEPDAALGENANEYPVGTRYVIASSGGMDDVDGGDFACYKEFLFYKAEDVFVKIEYKADETGRYYLDSNLVINSAYVPTIQRSTDPSSGAGLPYQPENRLSPYKIVSYSPTERTTHYVLPDPEGLPYEVYVDGVKLPFDDWGPHNVTQLGYVDFLNIDTVPQAGDNNVEIKYYHRNIDAENSVMRCKRMAVFGGAQDLCIVVGNTPAQPNAYFWNGNSDIAMDPTYFPMNQYNLAGDAADEITGFGKQQNMLVVFQPSCTGRAVMGTVEINERAQITMNYTRINSKIGCDLPGSIQLVENNLVWCNRRLGVCRLKDSSAAYENNIVPISQKINGDRLDFGLLPDLRAAADVVVRSVDTGQRYIVTVDDKAYEWNYELSGYADPSWFYHTGIKGYGFAVTTDDRLYEVSEIGGVWEFQDTPKDGGTPIEKVYTFPPRNFGSYDRLKNIQSILLTTRGDLPSNTQIEYICDYGSRIDPTPLKNRSWRLVPRDLQHWSLACNPFAYVARRKPGYHNVRHLQLKLYNNELDEDMSVISAQIFYTFRGRQR